ncbi:MAG: lipid-binding SYLF domain-containing protein, partial [Bryobacteraceae bacterium]
MKKKSMFAFAATAIMAFPVAALAKSSHNSGINHELQQATHIIQSMTSSNTTAGIPSGVLKDAKCVAVIPNLVQGGFIVGGRHGSGVATCKESDGQWSPPAPFSLSGASFGAQIGGQSINLVMMVMNNQGMQSLVSGHFKLGAGVSAAAGPTGRQASASGGWNAAILTYSHTQGAYAGATVKGAEIQQDNGATKALYGHDATFGGILNGQV